VVSECVDVHNWVVVRKLTVELLEEHSTEDYLVGAYVLVRRGVKDLGHDVAIKTVGRVDGKSHQGDPNVVDGLGELHFESVTTQGLLVGGTSTGFQLAEASLAGWAWGSVVWSDRQQKRNLVVQFSRKTQAQVGDWEYGLLSSWLVKETLEVFASVSTVCLVDNTEL